jgi:hypothetical protein
MNDQVAVNDVAVKQATAYSRPNMYRHRPAGSLGW